MRPISINIPAYNAEKFLPETIESIFAQDHRDFELIVVDDGSTDRTAEIVKQYSMRDGRLKLFSQPNLGVAAGRNKAIELSRYEWIMAFDADDLMRSGCVSRQIAVIEQFPELVGVGCLAEWITERGNVFWRDSGEIFSVQEYELAMRARNPIYVRNSGLLARKAALEKIGGYRKLPMAEDIDLVNRLADLGPIITNSKFLYQYRVHRHQATEGNALHEGIFRRWLSASVQARRTGKPEPAWGDYLLYRETGNRLRSLVKLDDLSRGINFQVKRYLGYPGIRLAFYTSLALLLAPFTVLRKLRAIAFPPEPPRIP